MPTRPASHWNLLSTMMAHPALCVSVVATPCLWWTTHQLMETFCCSQTGWTSTNDQYVDWAAVFSRVASCMESGDTNISDLPIFCNRSALESQWKQFGQVASQRSIYKFIETQCRMKTTVLNGTITLGTGRIEHANGNIASVKSI